MIRYTQGNLLDAPVDAIVNTVNTVGVMGKGIALMFKEAYPENYRIYAEACKAKALQPGQLLITETNELSGPKWIVNMATKKHWRHPSKLEWIANGLDELRIWIENASIESIALPPLGCGNGGLDWAVVKPLIETVLQGVSGSEVVVYEPTSRYQNVAKKKGVEKLTPARALIAEIIRRYWVLGIECTLIETQKLAWFLERSIRRLNLTDPLDLRFEANRYGPYAQRLTHLLNGLDGSYLHCDKRIADASPFDTVWFEESKREKVELYLKSAEAREFIPALEATDELIDGFQSPLGMEALATVDWLITRESASPTLESIKDGLSRWPASQEAAERKQRIFTDKLIELALQRLKKCGA